MLNLHNHFEISTEKSNSLKIRIRPVLQDIEQALDRFHGFLKQLDLEEICAFDLEIAFYEVTVNIILHGGLSRSDFIEFTAVPGSDQISLRFIDPGSPFDPTNHDSSFDPQVAIRTRQKHGFGLVMIKRLVDKLSYERVDNRLNVVTLEINLCPKGVLYDYAKKAE
jgi:anti-sigma regulatory factor (Ser/Thr protein kinase)